MGPWEIKVASDEVLGNSDELKYTDEEIDKLCAAELRGALDVSVVIKEVDALSVVVWARVSL